MGYTVPAGISNKHLHVSEEDFKTLFGPDAEMSHFKDLLLSRDSSLPMKRSIS